MKTRLLLSTATALLIATGAASAQNMKKDEAPPARAPAAQRNAPAEIVAPPMKAGENKGAVRPSETTGQAPKASDAGKVELDRPGMNKGAADKTLAHPQATDNKAKPTDTMDKSTSNDGKPMDRSKASQSGEPSRTTTGQGAAASAGKLNPEQRTKITTVFKHQSVTKVAPSQINVSIRVGAKVPASVRFYPVPVDVVTIYPEWRGYLYILVGNEILIIEPSSHEIVAILDV